MTFETSAATHAFERFAAARIAIAHKAREGSVLALNRILANAMTLRDLYKKYQWQVSGAVFYELQALFGAHHEEQLDLIDMIAERIQALGGTCVAMAAEVAESTSLGRPPRNREQPQMQLVRLLEAHKRVLYDVRAATRRAREIGDDDTHQLLALDVIPLNEKQALTIRLQWQRGRASAGL